MTRAEHKLTIGNQTPDGTMWFGKVDGRDGAFVLSNPDANGVQAVVRQTGGVAARRLQRNSESCRPRG